MMIDDKLAISIYNVIFDDIKITVNSIDNLYEDNPLQEYSYTFDINEFNIKITYVIDKSVYLVGSLEFVTYYKFRHNVKLFVDGVELLCSSRILCKLFDKVSRMVGDNVISKDSYYSGGCEDSQEKLFTHSILLIFKKYIKSFFKRWDMSDDDKILRKDISIEFLK